MSVSIFSKILISNLALEPDVYIYISYRAFTIIILNIIYYIAMEKKESGYHIYIILCE